MLEARNLNLDLTELHSAYEMIGLDPDTSWQDAVDMVARILQFNGKEVDTAFEIIGHIINKAINGESISKEDDPSFNAKTVAETILNERMFFLIKGYLNLAIPKFFIFSLDLLNK
jgi:hypothetical protein